MLRNLKFLHFWFLFSLLPIISGAAALPTPAAAIARGFLVGQVLDAATNEPIFKVYILIDQNGAWEPTDAQGQFHFERALPVGDYSLTTYRVGFAAENFTFHISQNDTTRLTILLKSQAIKMQDVMIEAQISDGSSQMQAPEIVISGKSLQKQLGSTIAETLNNEPGISQRTMGPAPARPVIRGMSGDRLLLLEDGETTGDLSATSSDHAVSIEPMTTERIQVIRGPEALVYGSSTMGGVVNVVRGAIPRQLPHHLLGEASLQAQSVNQGYAGGFNLTAPVGPIALRVDGSKRSADDTQTPIGSLRNTSISTDNVAVGASYIHPNGFVGITASDYNSQYGIPPDPLGGHPSGVNIDMQRQHMAVEGEWLSPCRCFSSLEASYQFSQYQHAEIETDNSIGMEFATVTQTVDFTLHLRSTKKCQNGKIGLKYEDRLFDTGGLTFMPQAVEKSAAVYIYQEMNLQKFRLNGTLRYDNKNITPEETRESKTVGMIEEKQFNGISAGLGMEYPLQKSAYIGISLLRTFRAPTIPELFSEGPHLAAYAYEVGNANLAQEHGFGSELYYQLEHANGNVRAAVFYNRIDHYIFPENTGQKSLRRADLYVYQFTGMDAILYGAELSWKWQIFSSLQSNGVLSYVHGDVADWPLPMMPPLEGKIGVTWQHEHLNGGVVIRGAAAQNRLGNFETQTAAFAVLDVNAQYFFSTGNFLNVLTVSVENVTDTVYRQHLNRVKQIMPEPGRNFKILLKTFF